jgi:hypothetical protein
MTNSPDEPRKPKPHRGDLMMILGVLSLVVGPPIVSVLTWVMAHKDLKEMDAGTMDAAGRSQTRTARLMAMISTVLWPAIFVCCCCGMIGNQFIQGSRFVSALGSRRITKQEFERVQFGMTKEQVRALLGPPARTEIEEFHHRWYYDEKAGPATFQVDFTNEGRVQGLGTSTPD